MCEVEKRTRIIEGMEVETWSKEIVSANIIEVEVGTNGYQGGDSGHGGRTYFRLEDLAGTDITTRIIKNEFGDQAGIIVELGGDCELSTFIEALEFTIKVLKEQTK